MFNQKYDRSCTFAPDALAFLQRSDWPGNVRQLENIIERAVVLNPDAELTADLLKDMIQWNADAPEPAPAPSAAVTLAETATLKDATDALQRQLIEEALAECGSTYRAAERLGMSQSTLVRRAKQLGINTGKREGEI